MNIDPLAEHPNQIYFTPYSYAINNPIFHNDPDGKCPPWICGAIAGGLVEAGAQYIVNLSKGDDWLQAAKNIDGADVAAATIEGGVTGGGSVLRRLLIKGTAVVASEVIQASIDVELDGDTDVFGTEGSSKDLKSVSQDAAIGIGANVLGEGAEQTIKAVTNSKFTKELRKANTEVKRARQGSAGESASQAKKDGLTSTIRGNEISAEATGTVVEEVTEKKKY